MRLVTSFVELKLQAVMLAVVVVVASLGMVILTPSPATAHVCAGFHNLTTASFRSERTAWRAGVGWQSQNAAWGPSGDVADGGSCNDLNVKNKNKSTTVYAMWFCTACTPDIWVWGDNSPNFILQGVYEVLEYGIANETTYRTGSWQTSTKQTVMT